MVKKLSSSQVLALKELQDAGIIDKNNNLTEYYKNDNLHKDKYNLFEWYDREYDDIIANVRLFIRSLLEDKKPIHSGDCTKDSCPCVLCNLESILSEYREYYLKENK